MSTAATATHQGSKDESLSKFPPQIKFIVGNEACERYSYYGMKSILVIFMIQKLLMQETQATWVYHQFSSLCYLFPLLGAFISDRFLGKYKTILYLSLVYCLGHGVLAVWENETGLYVGLFLIALGSGGIKPCVSAHVGDQFKKGQEALLAKVFNLFYFMINFGSFFSTIITPWTLKHYGPSVAFGVPGVLMFLATIIFWMGRKQYIHVPPTKSDGNGFLSVLKSALTMPSVAGKGFWEKTESKHGKDAAEGAQSVWGITKVFAAVSVFWALFDQHGSSWVIQATKMDLLFMGIQFEASQISAWNPIMVMGLIPIFTMGVYPTITKLGFEMTPLRRMTIGMFVAGAAFAMAAMIQHTLDAGTQLNVMWQFFPYLVMTIAEVMVSITGLEFAYTQAPKSMKSSIMSMWLLTVFFGNQLVSFITKIELFPVASANYFWFFAAVMGAFAMIFAFMASGYKTKNYMN
ncbi:MAG: POT family MFS transporter [Bacteriovoracaceae bacterium]|nr:POT family MFS transporter [Bacteriovoracaceae bacterium]